MTVMLPGVGPGLSVQGAYPQPPQIGAATVVAQAVAWYQSPVFTFTAGTETFTTTIQIDSDGDFLCVQTMYDNSLEADTPPVSFGGRPHIQNGGALIQLVDGASQRALMNAQNPQVPLSSIAGCAEFPYVWPLTHVFWNRTTIGISIQGNGAAVAGQVIRITFGGYKVPPGTLKRPSEVGVAGFA